MLDTLGSAPLSSIVSPASTGVVKLSSKLESYSETLSGSAGLFTGIGVLLVTLAASQLVFKFVEYLVINQAFGRGAWTSGLRVTDWKHGILQMETFYPVGPMSRLCGDLCFDAAIFLGSYFLFTYIGLRLRGRHLSDPKPKKKWRSSGESD